MKRTVISVFLVFAVSILTAKGNRYYYFDHLTTSDGLSGNTIYCTMQDSNGFLWIGTRDGLCRYDGNSFSNMSDIIPGAEAGGNIYKINEDAAGRIWFSSSAGVNIYDPYSDRLKSLEMSGSSRCFDIETDDKGRVWMASDNIVRYEPETDGLHQYSFDHGMPVAVAVDSYGTVWVALSNGSLYTYDARKDTMEPRSCRHRIRSMDEAEGGRLLVSTDRNEVMYLDCITMEEELLFKADKGNRIMCVMERVKGESWIGTADGLFIRKAGGAGSGEAFHDDATPESISADYITSLSKDNNGNVWVGTYYTGLNIWKNTEYDIARYFRNPSANSIKGDIVRSICEDDSGHLWLCTEDGWLNRFNLADHSVRNFLLENDLNLQGLVSDEDRIWVLSYGKGIWKLKAKTGQKIRHYDLPGNAATVGIKTKSGNILAGTTNGLYRLDRENDRFELMESSRNIFVHSLYQDSDGIIWIGTYGNGIICLDEGGNILSRTRPSEENGLTSRFITSFHEDSRHRMWVTTEGGGVCYTEPGYEVDNLRFSSLTTKDGLPSNVTCAVAEDNDGMIWMSTTNGIINLSEKDLSIAGLHNTSNTPAGYQFSYGAMCVTRNGVFYFGNTDGMVSFVPSKMKTSHVMGNLLITAIHAGNSEQILPLSEEGKSAMTSEYVKVKQKNASSLSINFVVPEYTSHTPLYSYTLMRNNHKGYSGVTHDNHVSYTGLRHGKYTFTVGVADQKGEYQYRKTLKIEIIPHPLKSNIAISIYVMICLCLLAGIVYTLDQKRKRDRARQLTKMNNRKEKEVYNAKINFFTNITHEIRTPLSLIKMPIDKIISSGAYNSSNEKDLRTIQANTDRLLNLTNQLLDMRKMENQEMRLSFVKEDACRIVHKAYGLFEQMAAERHITVRTEMPDAPIYMMCAKDSVLTIITNLLSNAIKYGNDLIIIRLTADEEGKNVEIRVESNGEIIPEHDRENIFKIFFQREGSEKGAQGTGIGLPYARTLANMHNGRLYLDDAVQDMNSFVLVLPAEQPEQITIEQSQTERIVDTEIPKYDSSKHTVLIVEDSSELRSYLAQELSSAYNILTAVNGADGLEIVGKEKIDLVISDIMMPIMDGCELCNRIKSDSDLSHVPVILLTAAVGVDTRLESLESGADGYIEKPFPIELLKSNINNLFRNKEIAYKQFISKPLTHYNSVTASKVDESYMSKVHDFIMKHIAEPDLNIENLTMQIGTSKSSLYRKLKANTGLGINEYIRLCRLKQAAELLSSQQYKINEVAFMTGFSSPSYFATCFLKQFNITPSEFVKNLGE